MTATYKLLITGGHPTPALAVIDYIQEHALPYDVWFAGRRHVNTNETADSYEFQEVTGRGITFHEVTFERGMRGALELLSNVYTSVRYIRNNPPDAILSFGGYIGVPLCIAAFLCGIPFYLHEQTIRPGTANILLGRLARKIMISFPQTESYFQRHKVVFTGNPLRSAIFKPSHTNLFAKISRSVIFVTGGNLGSHAINTHIFALLPQLLSTHAVIHQVGNVAEYGDWEKAQTIKKDLPAHIRDEYIPFAHLSTTHIAAAYQKADMVICRSGANTILELIALQKPALLIPLPWAAYNEQRLHAQLLSKAHAAEICEQNNTSEALLQCIQNVARNVQSYASNYESLAHYYVPQAAQHILSALSQGKDDHQRETPPHS